LLHVHRKPFMCYNMCFNMPERYMCYNTCFHMHLIYMGFYMGPRVKTHVKKDLEKITPEAIAP